MLLVYIFLLLTLSIISNVVADTDCLTEYSCVGTTIIETTGTISCYGLASCADCFINNVADASGSTRTTRCWGKRSCQSAQTFLGEVTYPTDIRAFLGLSWSNYVGSSSLYCYGEASCIEIANATCETRISCIGLRACEGIHGYDSDTVNGYAFLSLHNSILYNPFKVYLYSFFAGYNATIYCESGNTCNIYCYVNGCENLNFICDNDATCNVYYCDENEGIICPNGWNNNTISNRNEYNIENSIYYDTLTLINDIFKTSDGYEYILNDSIYIEDIYTNNECDSDNNNNDYECNDDSSCSYDTFNSNLNNLCCNGDDSCAVITVSNGFNNIYCDSSYACHYSSLNGNNNNNRNIYLRGRYGAWRSDISYFNNIFASGERACQECDISHGNAIGCFSYRSCYQATIINVTNIFAIGSQSFEDTIIISGGHGNEMNVFLLGYDNGYLLNITCLNNDICNIYCITNNVGCNDTSAIFQCGGNSNDCTINIIENGYTFPPTNEPTIIPSILPSNIPTVIPTIETNDPTQSPQIIDLTTTNTNDGGSGSGNDNNTSQQNGNETDDILTYVAVGLGFFVLITGMFIIYCWCTKRNENEKNENQVTIAITDTDTGNNNNKKDNNNTNNNNNMAGTGVTGLSLQNRLGSYSAELEEGNVQNETMNNDDYINHNNHNNNYNNNNNNTTYIVNDVLSAARELETPGNNNDYNYNNNNNNNDNMMAMSNEYENKMNNNSMNNNKNELMGDDDDDDDNDVLQDMITPNGVSKQEEFENGLNNAIALEDAAMDDIVGHMQTAGND